MEGACDGGDRIVGGVGLDTGRWGWVVSRGLKIHNLGREQGSKCAA